MLTSYGEAWKLWRLFLCRRQLIVCLLFIRWWNARQVFPWQTSKEESEPIIHDQRVSLLYNCVLDKLKSVTNCYLAELSFDRNVLKALISMCFKHLCFLYCTGRTQMTMTSKKGIAKCRGKCKIKLSIFSTGNFELYCVVITKVESSIGGTVETKTAFVEQLF